MAARPVPVYIVQMMMLQGINTSLCVGFSVAEARLGLRATQGNMDAAANFINEKRELRAESRRQAKKEKILRE